MRTIEAAARTSGSRADIWSLLADASTWTQWGSWSRVADSGGQARYASSSMRHFVSASGSPRLPTGRMAYELDGTHVPGYRAEVTLEEETHGGTVVRWRLTYERSDPLTALVLRLPVSDACKRLAKAASA
jgi:hypothetical protein